MTGLQRFHAHRGLTLLAERAVWREQSQTLWVADVHLGKAATYRALGQPAPAGTTKENLARLTLLVEACGAMRLVFLGDLFHARQAFSPALLAAVGEWRDRHRNLEIVLVRGNHDVRAGDPGRDLRIEIVDEPHAEGDIESRHHPISEGDATENGATVLAGHLHPTVRMRGSGRDSMRFPGFALQGRQVILPAFGEFTGGANIRLTERTSVCAITDAGLAWVRLRDRG